MIATTAASRAARASEASSATRQTRPTQTWPAAAAAMAPVAAMAAMTAMAAMAAFLASAPAQAAAPAAPTALAATASASPELQMPAGEAQKLQLQAPAAGTAGPKRARGEGKVAAGRPVAFLLEPDAAGMLSISVSSPQNAARLSIYLGASDQAESGTASSSGAIRWTSEVAAGKLVKVVIYTAGTEIPFRVEAVADAGEM
jgi:hypothetical protein